MRVGGLLEAALYTTDLPTLERFYVDVLGLRLVSGTPERICVLRCGDAALILFNRIATAEQGGIFPPHGAAGPGHAAFVIEHDELPAWRERLSEHGIAIEREITWPEGGISIYFRDPAGNSIELAPPTLWGGLGHALLRRDHLEG